MVLPNLAMIEWEKLTHAYGKATDVPQMLRGLASGNHRKRAKSLTMLYGTIWHQGTVYEATSAAIPFLYELLQEPNVRGKAGILILLQTILSAYPRADDKPDSPWRNKPYRFEAAIHTESRQWALRARQIGVEGVETVMELLSDTAPRVRATAALTLPYCVEQFLEIERGLRRRIDAEAHPVVKAAMIHVWARLWKESRRDPMSIRRTLRRLLHNRHEKSVVRFMSGLGLLPFLEDRPYPKLTRFLTRAYQSCAEAAACFSRFDPSFDIFGTLADRPDMRLDLCLAWTGTPGLFEREHQLYRMERLCRERRSNFVRVIPALGQLLSDGDSEFRGKVAMRLSGMGTWTRLAREPLIQALQDSNPDVANWSAVALSKLREPRLLPFLIRNLAPENHADVSVNHPTSTTPISDWLRMEQTANMQLRGLRLLLQALRPYGSAGHEAVPHLHALLTSRGPDIQKMVCGALAHIGVPALGSVSAVARLLRHPKIQCEAAASLAHWGACAIEAAPELVRFLMDFPQADRWAKISAIKAIGCMGVNSQDVLSMLREFLREADTNTKCEAAVAIWKIAPGSSEVIEVLMAELQEKTNRGWAVHGCLAVVKALEVIGRPARVAEPILRKLLDDPDGWCRVHSARALWRMGVDPPDFRGVLIDDLLCRPLGISTGILAAECLAEMGHRAAAAVPRIKEILAREDTLACDGTGWVESDEAYREALSAVLRTVT
jgi:hypothetical protein